MANGEPDNPVSNSANCRRNPSVLPGTSTFSIFFGRLLHDAEICLLYEKSFLILCWNPDFSHSTLS